MNMDFDAQPDVARGRTRGPDAPVPPRRPDGSMWRYEMVFDGGRRRSYADDLTVLTGELIGDYGDLAPAQRRAARAAHAHGVQAAVQARLIIAIGLAGCSSAGRLVLDDGWSPAPAIQAWAEPVPLVLVDSDYEPFTSTPRPIGRDGHILWLDTTDDETYLTSLTVAGEVILARSR